jgi:hypothetical protein
MKGLRTALTLACIGLFATPAHAQAYPTKPVTIVVTVVIERGHFACCLRTPAPAFSFARANGAALAPGAVG